jgi:hypothetical protein
VTNGERLRERVRERADLAIAAPADGRTPLTLTLSPATGERGEEETGEREKKP